jgi:hypothetical protein
LLQYPDLGEGARSHELTTVGAGSSSLIGATSTESLPLQMMVARYPAPG